MWPFFVLTMVFPHCVQRKSLTNHPSFSSHANSLDEGMTIRAATQFMRCNNPVTAKEYEDWSGFQYSCYMKGSMHGFSKLCLTKIPNKPSKFSTTCQFSRRRHGYKCINPVYIVQQPSCYREVWRLKWISRPCYTKASMHGFPNLCLTEIPNKPSKFSSMRQFFDQRLG